MIHQLLTISQSVWLSMKNMVVYLLLQNSDSYTCMKLIAMNKYLRPEYQMIQYLLLQKIKVMKEF